MPSDYSNGHCDGDILTVGRPLGETVARVIRVIELARESDALTRTVEWSP